jgi:hypothetical protein
MSEKTLKDRRRQADLLWKKVEVAETSAAPSNDFQAGAPVEAPFAIAARSRTAD